MNHFLYDHALTWLPEGSRVLDLGTGDGAFMLRMVRERNIHAEGVERDPALVMRCIEQGLEVHQGDILEGLDQYGDGVFDFALILGTFQELTHPGMVLKESFRVSKQVCVGYENMAYWRYRSRMMFSGKTPMVDSAPVPWYESPTVQFFSIHDFDDFCASKGIEIKRSAFFNHSGEITMLPNLRAGYALVQIEAGDHFIMPDDPIAPGL